MFEFQFIKSQCALKNNLITTSYPTPIFRRENHNYQSFSTTLFQPSTENKNSIKDSSSIQFDKEKIRKLWRSKQFSQAFDELSSVINHYKSKIDSKSAEETSNSNSLSLSKIKQTLSNAFQLRGAFLSDLQKYDSAWQDFSNSLDLDPNNQSARMYRGNILLEREQYEDAIQEFDRILENRREWTAYLNRAFAHRKLQRPKEAIRDYSEALKLKPNDISLFKERARTYMVLGNAKNALRDFSTVLSIDDTLLDVYAERCTVNLKIQNIREAIDDATRIIDSDPSDEYLKVNAYFLRANANYSHNLDPEQALEDFNTAAELGMKDSGIDVMRGNLLLVLNRNNEAIERFQKAIENDAQDMEAYIGIAGAYFTVDDPQSALNYISKAIELDPNLPKLYIYRAAARLNLLGDHQETVTDCSKAIELYGGHDQVRDVDVFMHRATANLALGRTDDALTDCNWALTFNPNEFQGYLLRGRVYAHQGKNNEAVDDLREAVQRGTFEVKQFVEHFVKAMGLSKIWNMK